MDRIAILGDIDSIKGFACLGLDIYPCKEYEDSKAMLKKLISSECPLIYITENIAQLLTKEIEKNSEATYPIITTIPAISGNTGVGMERLKQAVERAVGTDIIFGE